MDSPPPASNQTQTWVTIISSAAAALGALLAKKRFTRKPPCAPLPKADLISRTEFHQGLDTIRNKLDEVHKDLASAITAQSALVEKRLDVLDSAVARLDERTKILSTFAASDLAVPTLHTRPNGP